jgi:acetyltransferase-like isoleucine patch superfamily enzyme
MVLPGVSIGENAIVGAQATVAKDVPPNEIFAGNPAHKMGTRKIKS